MGGLGASTPTRGVGRATSVVLLGSVAGYGVGLLLTPILSRLFTPAHFGLFATLTAVASVFVGVSTFRLEVLAQRESDPGAAESLLRLALRAALAWGAGLAVLAALAVAGGAPAWWLAVGPLVTLASLQLIGAAVLTRQRAYRRLAVANLVQGAGAGVSQVVLGLLSSGPWALVAGFAAARLTWWPAIAGVPRSAGGTRRLREVWRAARPFAGTSGGSALVNSLAGQAPVLIGAATFGHAEVGLLAMALRLLVAPLGVVGQAAAAATVGEVGRLLRESDPTAEAVARRTVRGLALVGAAPCLLAGVAGVWLVPWALGPDWGPAGVLLAILAPGALAQFCVAPVSQLMNLTGQQGRLLAWDLSRLGAVGLSFAVPALAGLGLPVAVAAYSGCCVLLYAALARLVLVAVRTPRV